ncbi:MAG: hypothetical protein ACNS60_08165 [Candidatus Cyclobacteriaceae bacterium M2_1C_046]
MPDNLIRIHGTADKLFPCKKYPDQFTVKDGQHLMIINKAVEVSSILNDLVRK